jgi:signal transduction histidine kinase
MYRRRFLYSWAISWLAFALYIATLIANGFLGNESGSVQFIIDVITQQACFMQVVLILRGTHEMVSEKAINRKRFRFVFLFFLLVALSIVFIYDQPAINETQHDLLQYGSITLTSGLGFLVTGIVVWSHRKFTKGFGQRLLALSFTAYSFYELLNFLILLFSALHVGAWTVFHGVTDMFLISVMGLGMVMWLLEDERQKLEKANKELDRFMYSASHDLRAPIASILGLTYLGKIDFQEEKARTFMQMIEDRIRKLDAVISDILNLSKTKKFEIKIQPVRLRDLLDDVVADIKFNKNASSITLDYTPDPLHVFRSDYGQMKIVMCNLMGNAVKYHNLDQPSPYIKVSFRRHSDYVEISVEDNGPGIPESNLPHIFEMFYRASESTEGTGLGLYIVNEALTKIKGSIEVDSAIGKGSIFTIYLEDA